MILAQPIRVPLAGLGPKTIFVQGRADGVTSLARVRALVAAIGARAVETGDDHLSYSFRNPGAIVGEIESDRRFQTL